MRAMLMWTINDFSAYTLISGWSTKGELVCSICEKYIRCKKLTYRKSFSFIRHRCFLRRNHLYRRDAHSFNGIVEEGEALNRISESEMLRELDGLSIKFEKGDPIDGKKRKHRSKVDDTYFN